MHNSTRPPQTSLPPNGPQQPEEPSTRERIARVKTLASRAAGHWKMAFLLFVVGCGVAVGLAWNLRRTYRSECIVRYQSGLSMGEHDDSPAERASKLAPKLKEQLMTRSRLETVIKEFKLYPKVVDSQGMLAAVDEMRDKYVGFHGKDSDSYVISFVDESPETAQKVTQRLADTMIDEYSRGTLDQVLKQEQFLTVEENSSETELVMANRAFASFLAAHPEFMAELKKGGSGGPGMATGTRPTGPVMPDKVSSGDAELDALAAQKWRLENQIKAIREGTPIAPTPILGTPQQEAKLAKAKRDREEASKGVEDANSKVNLARAGGASDVNPDMVLAKRQLDGAKASMAAADVAVRDAEMDIRIHANPFDTPTTNGNADELKKKLADIDARIEARRQASRKPTTPVASGQVAVAAVDAGEPLSDVVRLEADFQKLSRSLSEKKSLHDDLRQKLERAQLELARERAKRGNGLIILDPAYRPMKPATGGRSKTAMSGGAAALFVALLYAFARVIFNDTMIDAADIEALKLIPVLGVLPKIPHPQPQPPGTSANPASASPVAKGGSPGAV